MNRKDVTRSEPIKIMTTAKEKAIITEKAQQFGGSISEYIRAKILSDNMKENGKMQQELAALMCRHSLLTERISASSDRKSLENWEEEVWPLLK